MLLMWMFHTICGLKRRQYTLRSHHMRDAFPIAIGYVGTPFAERNAIGDGLREAGLHRSSCRAQVPMMPLPNLLEPSHIALFLDFDGTLVDIADRPESVKVGDKTPRILGDLHRLLDGAVAIITGRDIADIDAFLAPLRLPVAGVHGATRRDAGGHFHASADDGQLLEAVEIGVQPLMADQPGLLLERKQGSVALHYRSRPELEAECSRIMQGIVDKFDGAVLKRGKMVVEAIATASDKGKAVAAFMSEAPFAGRRPVVAGDDVTDEDAFMRVNALGGTSIKIGADPTCAAWRACSTQELHGWLEDLTMRLITEERIFSSRRSQGDI